MHDAAATVGRRLRAERLARRIWQRDLAAATGLSAGYLSELEHDQARATEATWRRLALALGLEAYAFIEQAASEGRLAPAMGHRGKPDPAPRPCRTPISRRGRSRTRRG